MRNQAYWKQIRYNEFLLFGAGYFDRFPDYAALYAYCQRKNIDAKQA